MKITSINDPLISEFLSLRMKTLKKHHMIAESPKVVIKAIKTNQTILKIFCTKEFVNKHQEILGKYNEQIFTADKELMQEIIGHKLHHGVMALVERPQNANLNELGKKIIILNGLTSPENVGTIIRTAASFNIRSIIVDKKTCSPYMRRCIRVSMGNIFFVKVHLAQNLLETIKELKKKNYETISAANSENAKSLSSYHFKDFSAVIIGSEGHGIDKELLNITDEVVRIDIEDDVAHINAASAASIFLYELQRSSFS